MTHDDRGGRRGRPPRLEGSVKTARVTERGIELVLRVRNPGARALHYISDVRVLRYDPATQRLTVRLSDDGLEVLPGIMAKLPQFRAVDPQSEAEFSIELPEKIVKLSEAPAPPGELSLQEHRIADAKEIDIDIAWADTPFYQDPRSHDDKQLPAARWQQGELRVSHKMEPPPRRRGSR
jgi:hypothetical protein